MPVVEYLDDVEAFVEEVLDVDMRPTVRVQGRGKAKASSDGFVTVEAEMVLTHYEPGTDIIRECSVHLGTAPQFDEERVEKLRGTLNEHIAKTERELADKGAIVKKGRWTR